MGFGCGGGLEKVDDMLKGFDEWMVKDLSWSLGDG